MSFEKSGPFRRGAVLFFSEIEMTKFPVLNFQDFIQADGDALTTTSLQVAAVFGKQHAHVMRDIRALIGQLPEERRSNFGLCFKNNELANGKAEPFYTMTRDGFTWLAMRFRGKRALAFQVAYTDAFNAMAAYIKNQREGLQYQFLQKELEYKGRKSQISHAAREMRSWQDEKPERLLEMDKLMAEIQPSLQLH